MRKYLLAILLILPSVFALAQSTHVDSLQHQLIRAKDDTAKASLLEQLTKYYLNIQQDSGIYYGQQLVQLSQKINYPYGEAIGFFYLSSNLDRQSNYANALEMAHRCLRIAEVLTKNKNYVLSLAYFQIGLLNRLTKNDSDGIFNLQRAVQLAEQSKVQNEYLYHFYSHLAAAYNSANKLDSALFYAKKGYRDEPGNETNVPFALITLARIYEKLQHPRRAKEYYLFAIQKGKQYNSVFPKTIAENSLAALYLKTGPIDSCIYYARIALAASLRHHNQLYAMNASSLLSQAYEAKNNSDSTLKYLKKVLGIKDSVFNQAKMQQFQLIAFDEQQRQQLLKVKEEQYQNRIRLYALFAALVVFLLIAVILYRNNQQKQKAKRKIEKAYEELKATQAQLIQQEKMASLGELTAGIAHEIQNPLNFVNNFSEVNAELLTEIKDHLAKENLSSMGKENIDSIIDSVNQNLERISQHGKRADGIVKGMLLHSRSSGGQKELTNLNNLADEYLRLSYHGLRAKDKSFNATLVTHFDPELPLIEVISQDIGRVLINLFNNAFYSVNQKCSKAAAGYEPTITVTTQKVADHVQVKVRDNGMGIAKVFVEKIYHPFFTTKPSGQGTGLGLSLSYDIIKAHQGELILETMEGEFAEFTIVL